jgi:hypothetical protein
MPVQRESDILTAASARIVTGEVTEAAVLGDHARESEWTVARVRSDGGDLEVMFYESPRVCRLPRGIDAFEDSMRVVLDAVSSGARVRVMFTEAYGDVIARVSAPRPV